MQEKEKLAAFINEHSLFQPKTPVLLGVSGGIDSTTMCYLFRECGFNFGIAHINFQLRGYESDEDEKFVTELAQQFRVAFFTERFDTALFAKENKISIQMAARTLRYGWLEQIRRTNSYHFVATAHHQDDRIETVLLNMFRGSGIRGLHGMKPKQDKIIRPMLCFSRDEIESFAGLNHIPFRQDRSNFETEYYRNKIRHEIIPSIEKHYPSFKNTFSENIEKWKDAEWLYDQMVSQVKKKVMEKKGEETFISISRLKLFPVIQNVLFEILKEFDFNTDQSRQVAASLNSISGKIFYSSTHRLIKDRKHLIILLKDNEFSSEILIFESDQQVSILSLHMVLKSIEKNNFIIPKENAVHCLDQNLLEFPLLLRRWKKGDYFYPFGMKKKKKKISDYLIDKKIPLHQKDKIFVIESGGKIVAVAGERIDERFKITDSTEKIFIIKTTVK